jgi:hypothetical protein
MSRLTSLITLLAGLMILIAPAVALAQFDPLQAGCEQGAQDSAVCEDTGGTKPEENPLVGEKGIITRATQVITIGAGVAAVVMMIVGGFKYITSSGDPNNVNSAKNTILYAAIGLVIALIAQAIVVFVLRKL